MKRPLSLLLVTTIISLMATSGIKAQRSVEQLQSLMIYNFTKYIHWPDNGSTEFTIGVMSNDASYNTLKKWYSGKVKGNKTFIVKRFTRTQDIVPCEIIFLSSDKSQYFESVRSKIPDSPTLLITDSPGMAQKGAGINFKKVNSRQAFELNKASLEGRKLKISSQLLSIAIVI